MSSLPETQKALILSSRDQPLEVKERPVPQPGPGAAVVRILAATVFSYAGEVYSGQRPYPFPTPLIPGASAVGRVAAVGPDATLLKEGQLVFIETTIRSRDNPEDTILLGVASGYTDGSRKLMDGEWRNGTWAEYARVPLENCYPLNEEALLNRLKYPVEVLSQFTTLMVTNGGLSDIRVSAGETIIVTPATGPFGSAAVRVAVARGARVIAMGRNKDALEKLRSALPSGRVIPIPLVDAETDSKELAKYGPIDAYFDISPPQAAGSYYIKSSIMALRHGARISLMGGFQEDITLPVYKIMTSNMEIRGTFMSTREQNLKLIRLIEEGILGMGEANGWEQSGVFTLDKWEEALECAKNNARPGQYTVLKP